MYIYISVIYMYIYTHTYTYAGLARMRGDYRYAGLLTRINFPIKVASRRGAPGDEQFSDDFR